MLENYISLETENEARVFRHYQFDEIIGKVMPIIEILGLEERRESSLKQQIKKAIWEVWETSRHLYIPDKHSNEIFDLILENQPKTCQGEE